MKLFKIILFLSITAFSYAQTKSPIVASDLMKIATANQIQIAAGGNKAVMVEIGRAHV